MSKNNDETAPTYTGITVKHSRSSFWNGGRAKEMVDTLVQKLHLTTGSSAQDIAGVLWDSKVFLRITEDQTRCEFSTPKDFRLFAVELEKQLGNMAQAEY